MAVSKCVTHGLPIAADGCQECSRLVDEAIASAPRHQTIPVGVAAAEIVRLRGEVAHWQQLAAEHQQVAEDLADRYVEVQEIIAGAHGQLDDDGLLDDDYDAVEGARLLWVERGKWNEEACRLRRGRDHLGELCAAAEDERDTIKASFARTTERATEYRAEIAQLRIERDNAREMEDVHGDNWEAAQAEVERLRGERDELRAALTEIDRVLFPRRTGGLLPSADYVREIETLIELDEER